MELVKKLIGATPEEIPVRYPNGILSKRDNTAVRALLDNVPHTETLSTSEQLEALNSSQKQELLNITSTAITRVLIADEYDFSVKTGIGNFVVEFEFGASINPGGHGYQKMTFRVFDADKAPGAEDERHFVIDYNEVEGTAKIDEEDINGFDELGVLNTLLAITAHGEWSYTVGAQTDCNRNEAIGTIKTQIHRLGYFLEDLPAVAKAVGASILPVVLIALTRGRKS